MKENGPQNVDGYKLYVDERTAFLVTEEYHPPWESMKEEEHRGMHAPDWKSISETHNSAYFHLFEKDGHSLRSTIEAQSPSMLRAVDTLCATGKLIGQDLFDENGKVDTMYHMAESPSSEPIVVGPVASPKGLIRNFNE